MKPLPPLPASLEARYRLLEVLEEGPRKVVAVAQQVSLKREVVLKVLRTEARDEVEARAFLREARALSEIRHENVVRLLEFGEAPGGVAYLVLERVRGKALRRVISESGPLASAEALAVTRQILAGLGCLHEAGVVHRDLSCNNVLLTEDGGVKLIDLGIALLREEGDPSPGTATETGVFEGTPEYVAPERVLGEKGDVRSDIYSVGALLFTCLTGRSPFARPGVDPWAILQLQVNEIAPAPSAQAPVSPAIDRLVGKALEKEPSLRFASADAFAEAVDEVAGAPGEMGRQVRPGKPTRRLLAAPAPVRPERAEITAEGPRAWVLPLLAVSIGLATLLFSWRCRQPPTRGPIRLLVDVADVGSVVLHGVASPGARIAYRVLRGEREVSKGQATAGPKGRFRRLVSNLEEDGAYGVTARALPGGVPVEVAVRVPRVRILEGPFARGAGDWCDVWCRLNVPAAVEVEARVSGGERPWRSTVRTKATSTPRARFLAEGGGRGGTGRWDVAVRFGRRELARGEARRGVRTIMTMPAPEDGVRGLHLLSDLIVWDEQVVVADTAGWVYAADRSQTFALGSGREALLWLWHPDPSAPAECGGICRWGDVVVAVYDGSPAFWAALSPERRRGGKGGVGAGVPRSRRALALRLAEKPGGALTAASGEGRYALPVSGKVAHAPGVSARALFVVVSSKWSSSVVRVDRRDRAAGPTGRFEGWSLWPPLVTGGAVLCGSRLNGDGALVACFDAKTLAPRWRVSFSGSLGSGPVLHGDSGFVFVPAGKSVYRLCLSRKRSGPFRAEAGEWKADLAGDAAALLWREGRLWALNRLRAFRLIVHVGKPVLSWMDPAAPERRWRSMRLPESYDSCFKGDRLHAVATLEGLGLFAFKSTLYTVRLTGASLLGVGSLTDRLRAKPLLVEREAYAATHDNRVCAIPVR